MRVTYRQFAVFAGLAAVLASVAVSSVAAAEQSAQSKFLDACLARVDNKKAKIDPTVFKDCYTPDFVLMGPETHGTKDHSFHGKQAVDAKTRMGGGDSSAWGSVKFWTADEIESGDKIVRHMHWEAKNPKNGAYAGFTGLPPDMVLTDDVITIYTFRDGKIAKEFFAYDTLNFFMDLAQGDPKKMGDALAAMKPMMDAMKQTGALPADLSPPVPKHK
jgi:ketosteroid isomerase-like protein